MKNADVKTSFFNHGSYRFSLHELTDGRLQVNRVSPYDETEYHWAFKRPEGRGVWGVARNGKVVAEFLPSLDDADYETASEKLADELDQLACRLLTLDRKLGLKPRVLND